VPRFDSSCAVAICLLRGKASREANIQPILARSNILNPVAVIATAGFSIGYHYRRAILQASKENRSPYLIESIWVLKIHAPTTPPFPDSRSNAAGSEPPPQPRLSASSKAISPLAGSAWPSVRYLPERRTARPLRRFLRVVDYSLTDRSIKVS
jgi:hypothetical protein